MPEDEPKNKFFNSIKTIENLIEEYRDKRSDFEVKNDQIIREINEIKIILQIIYEEILEHDRLSTILQDSTGNVEKLKSYFNMGSKITIHIKALYQWLYNLYLLLEDHPYKNLLLTKEKMSNLKKYCEFRHNLITHKVNMETITFGGMIYKKGEFDIKLMKTPINVSKKALEEVNKVFESCKTYLSDKDSSEENFHDRLRILYRNLHKLEDKQKDVKDLIKRYGTISDEPIILVEFIKDLSTELIPNLFKCHNDFNLSQEACSFLNRTLD